MSSTSNRDILDILETTAKLLKTAKKGNNSLNGNNTYAKKLIAEHAEALKTIQSLRDLIGNSHHQSIIDDISAQVEILYDPKSSESDRQNAGNTIHRLYKTKLELILQKNPTHVVSNDLFPLILLQKTRGYLEKVGAQAAGCYDKGWYDGCAVMIRRLLETLIIECFEAYTKSDLIKNPKGEFFYLDELISTFLNQDGKGDWNVGRNVKSALPNLKRLGDLSAHNRRYNATKPDIDKIKQDLRVVIEELLHISKLR